jgi:predicted DNA-binding transcriptional regulator AlpA
VDGSPADRTHKKERIMSMAHDPDDELLTIKEVAAIVRAPEATVRYWRFNGTGPRSIKVGRRVCYWKSDVLRWLEDLAS